MVDAVMRDGRDVGSSAGALSLKRLANRNIYKIFVSTNHNRSVSSVG
jgi:hypothetical protein